MTELKFWIQYIYMCHSKVVMQVTSIVHRYTNAKVSFFTVNSMASQTCVYLLLLIFTKIKLFWLNRIFEYSIYMSLKGRDVGHVNNPFIYRCQCVLFCSKFKSIANMCIFCFSSLQKSNYLTELKFWIQYIYKFVTQRSWCMSCQQSIDLQAPMCPFYNKFNSISNTCVFAASHPY